MFENPVNCRIFAADKHLYRKPKNKIDMAKYINPFTDWGFKRLFGQEFSKGLPISFLNDLLEGELKVKDVTFHDKEQLASTKDLRGIIFDVYCTTDTGEHVIVEMQNRYQPFFINRSLYYGCRAITGQRKKSETLETPELYQLVPVYTICFMNFMPEEDELNQLRTDVILADRDTGKQISNKLRFVYLSLPYFKKTAEECETNFEKWIYVLKHMEALDRMPFTATNKIFKELAQYAASHNLTAEEQEKYDESMKVVTDYYSGLVGSYMRGEKQGRADGMAEGMVKGMAKGMAEGLAKGRAETRKTQIETAARLRAMGLSDEQIAKATGLSQEEMQH